MKFGFAVNTHGVGDLVAAVDKIAEKDISTLCAEYEKSYAVAPALRKGGARHEELRYSARIELGMGDFLEDGGYKGFTDTFEDLHGLRQLPGMATQRLMADGYGFGGEGDWKTATLVRAMKVMAAGLPGGTSFMEDYTYHLAQGPPGPRRAHARDLPVHRGRQTRRRDPPARHRRQGRSRAPRVRRPGRRRPQRLARRPRQPLPPHRQ
jgi:L-arabinose isomerase